MLVEIPGVFRVFRIMTVRAAAHGGTKSRMAKRLTVLCQKKMDGREALTMHPPTKSYHFANCVTFANLGGVIIWDDHAINSQCFFDIGFQILLLGPLLSPAVLYIQTGLENNSCSPLKIESLFEQKAPIGPRCEWLVFFFGGEICRDIHLGMAQQPVIPQVNRLICQRLHPERGGGAIPQVMCPVIHGGVMKCEMYWVPIPQMPCRKIYFS